jgi:tripartite-type tricarboxylate transporter receptor subunit TctC
MTKHLLLAFVLICAAFCTIPAVAQAVAPEWPTRPVKLYVPFGPGSTPDMVARVIADRLAHKLGQPFVVEDKPGASGNLGTDAVAKAEPDGYTLGISIAGPLAINALLFGKLPYDPAKDFTYVTMVATQPSALAVNALLGVNTVAELVALVAEIITAPDIRDKLATQLMEPIPGTPAQFRARIDADLARWAPVIRAANIRVN